MELLFGLLAGGGIERQNDRGGLSPFPANEVLNNMGEIHSYFNCVVNSQCFHGWFSL